MFKDSHAIPFEFNARFSGTTAIRSHFGFNEPAMAVQSYLMSESVPNPVITSGTVLRYIEEVFIDNKLSHELQPEADLGLVHSWF